LEDNHERWSPEYKRWMRRFAETQMQNYETASGWFFWNFKAEKSPHWNYMLGVREGWIPRNPNERTHKC
jgi:glucan 1,3-beta-glucosidase